MADKEEPKKKQSTIKQIIQIFKYTHAEDKALPWLCGGVFVAPIVVFVVLGIVFKWSVIGWITSMILAIMLGLLFATMMLTNRADKVGYAKLEGRQGAAISVLGNINKAGFNFPQEPVWVDPKTKDAIWRGTGYNGIYLLGEGDYNRVKRAMDRQEQNIKGVTAGSDIPVYRIYVGQGKNQTSLKNLRKTVLKCKSYQPQEQADGSHPSEEPLHAYQDRAEHPQRASAHSADEERHGHSEGRRPDAPAAHQPSCYAWPLIFLES